MVNQFVRRPMKFHERLQNALEGVVYQSVPADRLATLDVVLDAVAEHCKAHPEDGRFSRKEAQAALAALASRGCVQEVYGPRLERWLQTL